jgi:large repetitive protein
MDEILHSLRYRKTSLFKLFFCFVLLTFNVVKSEAQLVLTEIEHLDIECKKFIPPRTGAELYFGTIKVKATGGIEPYMYKKVFKLNGTTISTVTTTSPDFISLVAGTYCISVIDNNGTGQEVSLPPIVITEPATALEATTLATDVLCNGDAKGVLTTKTTGGTLPITIDVKGTSPVVSGIPSQNSNTITTTFVTPNLTAGTYSVVVKDKNGCLVENKAAVITEPDPIVATVSQICSSGKIMITASGGSNGASPYMYSLNGTNFTASNIFTKPATNPFLIYIKDGNDCIVQKNITLSPLEIIIKNDNPQCEEAVLDLDALNGVGPYTFTYSNDGTTDVYDPSVIPKVLPQHLFNGFGSYTISVTDANGCMATVPFEIKELTISLSDQRDIKCFRDVVVIPRLGDDQFSGGIEVMAMGGTSDYSFDLFYENGTHVGTYDNTNSTIVDGLIAIEPLLAGKYTITVNDLICGNSVTLLDDNGLPKIIEIKEPPAGTTELKVMVTQTNPILCKGLSTGELTITPIGGVGNKTVTFNGIDPENPSTLVYSGLAAGSYPIVVIDEFKCKVNKTVVISEPPPLSISIEKKCNPLGGYDITVVAGGGTAPYTYSKDNTNYQPESIFFNLPPGNRAFFIKDANGCITANYFIIPQFAITLEEISVDCNSAVVGLNAYNGTAPYTFTYTKSGELPTTETVTLLPFTHPIAVAGDYTISATDVNGCTDSKTYLLKALTLKCINKKDAICNKKGSFQVIAENGIAVGGYKYTLNGVIFTPIFDAASSTYIFDNLQDGEYTVVVTDDRNCRAECIVKIEKLMPNISITATPTNIACKGSATGVINMVVTGGTPIYKYELHKKNDISFKKISTQPIFDLLEAGTYYIVVTDDNGCLVTSQDIVITEPEANPLKATIKEKIITACDGGSATGEFTITIADGTLPITFSVDGGARQPLTTPPTFVVSNLAIGPHTIVSKDATGCTVTSIANVFPAEAFRLITSSLSNNFCVGDKLGKIFAGGFGGTKPYAYSIDPNLLIFTTSGEFDNLLAGDYTVTAKDANGCMISRVVNIRGTLVGPSVSMVATDVSCNGQNTGKLVVTTSNTSGAISFSKDGVFYQESDLNYTNPYILTGLTAGVYTATVKDSKGCTASDSKTITEPTPLVVALISVTRPCPYGSPNGTVTVNVTGGSSPYSYSINGGSPVVSSLNSYTFPNIGAGPNTVLVKDANNCMQSTVLTVTPQPSQDFVVSKSDVTCSGSNNGKIIIYDNSIPFSGQTNFPIGSQFEISLDGGATFKIYTYGLVFFNAMPPPVLGFEITNLPIGNYSIILRSVNGCAYRLKSDNVFSLNLTINIAQPAPLSIGTITTTLSTCATGGSIKIIGTTGGTVVQNYKYSLSSTLSNTTGIFTNIPSGDYTLTVTDDNGCLASTSVSVSRSTLPSITVNSTTDVLCNGSTNIFSDGSKTGAFTFTVSSGTTPYNVVIKDALNNVVSSIGTNPYTASTLVAGTYNISVTDGASCVATQSVTITKPTPLSITDIIVTDVLCKGDKTGKVEIIASGGTGSYMYDIVATTFKPSNIISGLGAGNYTFEVKDANGCIAVLNKTVGEPMAPLSILTSATQISCFGGTGSVVLSASGGTANYTFTGDATTGLVAGRTYNYLVTDAKSCTASASVILNAAPSLLVLTATPTQISCFGGTGSVALNVSGGTANYTYTGDATTGLVAGRTYNYFVKDAKGCTATASVMLNAAPSLLVMTATATQPKCFGEKGSVVLSAKGGTGAYTYSGDATSMLAAGITYNYKVTDANGCIATASVAITQPSKALSLSLVSQTDIKCFGDLTGKIDVKPTGGTPPYSYEVDGTAFPSSPFTDLVAKLPHYVIKVIDNNVCTATLNVTLTQPTAPLSILSNPSVDVLCKGNATGSITINATGGTATLTSPYMYSIDNGVTFQPSNIFNNLLAKIYKVVVKDANSCVTAPKDVEVKEPNSKLALALTNQINLDCIIRTGSATFLASGGTGSYAYTLGSITQKAAAETTFTNLAAGNYIVSVTDANNCLATTPLSILDNKVNPIAPNALSNITLCKSEQVDLTPRGSTGTYNFFDKNPLTNVSSTLLATNVTKYSFIPTTTSTIWITAVTGVCESTPIAVTVTILAPLKLTAIPTKPICPNGTDGKIDLTITGGITPYIINWTGPNGFVSTNEDLTGLKAGTYTVEVGLNGFTCKETIQVIVPQGMDMTPPTIKTKDLTVYLDAQGKATVTAQQLNNGSTDNCLLQSIAIDKGAFTCGNLGANTVVFTATDASGNIANSNVIVTILDNIKPVITCPAPIEITLNALECSRKIDFAAATATDNCSAEVTQMSGLTSGSLFEAGTYKVTYKATDPSGNTADCSVDIKVNEYKAGGTMICFSSVNLSIGELCINKITPNMILLGNDYRCLNSYNVMLKDKNGRLVEDDFIRASHIGTRMTISVVDPKTGSSCWGYANVEDKTPPTIQCPFDALVSCDEVEASGSPLSILTGEPRIIYECSRTTTSYVDEIIEINCSTSFTTKPANFPSDLTFSVDKGLHSSKIIIRTFTVSDIYGNASKCKQLLTV